MTFTIIVPTIYGQMLVNRHDINQSEALIKTGMAIDCDEIEALGRLIPNGGGVVDVGANVGTYTLRFARAVGSRGWVHAFEPQRPIFHMLAGSVALGGYTNVVCHQLVVGARTGKVELPQFDYSKPLNFGSVEFGPGQMEALDQERKYDPERVEYVPVMPLDSWDYPRLDLLKIDVEGMERAVLDGAIMTLERCRPIVHVEFWKSDREAIRWHLERTGYTVLASDMNFLAIPPERMPESLGTLREIWKS